MANKPSFLLHFIATIFILTATAMLPLIIYPDFFLARQNDLSNFFLPLITTTKHAILTYHTPPLWNPSIFSGTPLVTDPQAPIFYLPNILHLFLPHKPAFLLLAFLHIYTGALGVFVLLRRHFKLSPQASYLGAVIYLFQPRLGAYFEAGHIGLIYSWAYLPWLAYFIIKLGVQKERLFSLGMAIFLAGLFYTHTPTFMLAAIVAPIVYLVAANNKKLFLSHAPLFILGVLISFGLIAIAFLPQLTWQNQTNRQFLLNYPEIYPVWRSKWEFIRASINPFLLKSHSIWSIDTEKYISLGFFSLALAGIGWWHSNKRFKITTLLTAPVVVLIALANASPIYPLLMHSKFFILLRVMTRVWFIPVVVVSVSAAQGFQVIYKNKPRMGAALSILAVAEISLLFWGRIIKPINIDTNKAPEAVYSYLQKHVTNERVFCTTKCLNYNKAASHNIELLEGYGTLVQNNYYRRSKVTVGTFWHDKYDLSIPPSWITYSEQLDPQAIYLAEYSVEFVVSPHPLTDKNLTLVNEINGFKIYKNQLTKPRAYFADGTEPDKITITPNKLTYDFNGQTSGQLILSEVYSPGWHAFLDGQKIPVTETEISQRSVQIAQNAKVLRLYYFPKEFVLGLTITGATIILIIIYAIKIKKTNI